MFDSDKYDLIEKHFSGQLSPSEKQQFEELLQNDASFAAEVEKEAQANELIHQLGLMETSSVLDDIHQGQRVKTRNKFIAAGSVTVAVGVLGYFSLANNNNEQPVSIQEKQTVEVVIDNSEQTKTEVIVLKENDKSADENQEEQPTIPVEKQTIVESKEKESEVISNTEKITESNVDTIEVEEQKSITEADSEPVSEPIVEEVGCSPLIVKNYKVEASCIDEDNGKLVFSESSIQGGTSPYNTKLYSIEDEDVVENGELAPGNYFLEISDANGCRDTLNGITISEKWCVKRIDDSFSPIYGETWQYPLVQDVTEYTFVLRNVNQSIVLEKRINTDEIIEWDGRLDNGTIANEGIYFIEIKGTQSIYFTGTLTVVK